MVLALAIAFAIPLAGCGQRYSPDVYATNAAQQASKVEPGVIVGVRKVRITAAGTTGAVAGAAAGGIAGSQAGIGPTGALTTLGGTLLGGLAGVAVERGVSDTDAFEYVVRKPNGEMVSVTQKDENSLKAGQKVLVISGAQQARIVVDYTVPLEKTADKTPEKTGSPGTAQPVAPPAEAPSSPAPGASSSGAASATVIPQGL